MPPSTIITIEGIGPVLLERSTKAKHLNITIKPFKGVRVAVPKGVPFNVAEQLTRAKSKWLDHHISRIKKFEKLYKTASANETTIDKKEATRILVKRLEEILKNTVTITIVFLFATRKPGGEAAQAITISV